MTTDDKHLDLLATLHYVLAGLLALFACLPLLHVGMGIAVLSRSRRDDATPEELIGTMMIVLGGLAIVLGWSLAVVVLLAARRIARRRSYRFCIVAAALECLFSPLGTALGVITIVVLLRDGVRERFEGQAPRETDPQRLPS